MLYNESTIVCTPFMIRILRDAIRQVVVYFEKRMSDILKGPKSHDLQHHLIEDLVQHGNPASYDCSPGESKMRVQKLKKHIFKQVALPLILLRK